MLLTKRSLLAALIFVAALAVGIRLTTSHGSAGRIAKIRHVEQVASRRNVVHSYTASAGMQTVTPYQLQKIGIQLSATSATPSIPPAQADAAATLFAPESIIETVLADCTVGLAAGGQGNDLGPCYVVSFQAPDGTVTKVDPSGGTITLPGPTVQLELISATNGSFLQGVSAYAPASP